MGLLCEPFYRHMHISSFLKDERIIKIYVLGWGQTDKNIPIAITLLQIQIIKDIHVYTIQIFI